MMSVELLKLTSAALPSSDKPVPRICKPAASTSPTKNFDDSIFSPLPMDKAAEETPVHCQVDAIAQEPPLEQLATNNPSFSPITVTASDNFALFGAPTSSPTSSNHEDVSSEGQSSLQSILSSNTSTPQVKILSSKLKEIPPPDNGDKCNSSYGADVQTPPRALGMPISKKNYESRGGLHLKPNSRTKPVRKALSQGIVRTGPMPSLASESSPDDSIVVVHLDDTERSSVKDKLCQKKGTNLHKHTVIVYPNVLQHKEEDKVLSTKEAKGIQTESFSMKFDEGTQCGEKVVMHTRAIQTSPSSRTEFGNPDKKQCPVQNQHHPLQLTATTTLTSLMDTVTPRLSSNDAVTLIASTAAAAAVAASASLHNNNKHTKDACLNARNGSVGLQKHLRQTCTTTRTDAAVRTPTQTVTPDHDELDMSKALDHPETVKSSSQPSHFHSSEGNSLIDKKTRIIFDHLSDKKDSHRPQRSELLKQKYEKSSIGDVLEVLQSAAVVQEEIEHRCAALECTSTLTDFTEAMIEGRPIQERMRIHQSINKLIEQTKDEEIQLPPGPNPSASRGHGRSLETKGGKSQWTRQSAKSNQRVTKLGKRKADCQVENYHRHVCGNKLNYTTGASKTAPKTDCGILMNTLWHDGGWQMNFTTPRAAAVPLGPPRQSKSHHNIPTTPASSVANTFKSVGCQAPSNPVTPVKAAENFRKKKPYMSSCSIKLLPPVNISSSSGVTEATMLSAGKPSSTVPTAPSGHDDNPHDNNFQQVQDIYPHSTTNDSDISIGVDREGEGIITLEGEEAKSSADYQGPSFPPKPAERLSAYSVEPSTMSASELDKRLKENLEQKAMEWIHQELLVRLVADRRQDPVGHTINTCSTCTTNSPTEDFPGVHKIPPDKESECVEMLVCEEVLGLIKTTLKERLCKREEERMKESETPKLDNASSSVSELCHLLTPDVTPPSTPANLHSTTSSPDHMKLVTTPLPTPPQSPATLSVQQLVENSIDSETNRVPAPLSSLSSFNDDIDSLKHNIQPEAVVSSNLSSPSTTQQTITTSVHTPQASSEPTKKPPAEEPVTKHTTDPTTSSTESCSTAGSSPAVSDATTSSTTDYEISMGEYIVAKPTVIQRAKKADYSLSEGEVPLSPGDARWNALHAGKLRGHLREKKKKDITRPNHPVVEAFLDLKQSCESDSATEFSADSLQLKPQSLSNGEIRGGGSHDPFKKLLDKLNSSNSSSDSAGAQDEEKDNTLSEVTSFATQEDITSVISSSPLPANPAAGVTATDETSPGELVRKISVLAAPPKDEPSLGEVNHPQVVGKVTRSPGEVPPILRASETRNGIDVIRISKWSDKLPSNDDGQKSAPTSESQYLMQQFDSSEVMQTSSQSSVNTLDHSTSQHLPVTGRTSADDGPTESHSQPSSLTKPRVVEGEVNRKVVTISIPDATAGFYSEDTSNRECSTEMSFTISEITTSLSSENF